jgi:hypothetical protein
MDPDSYNSEPKQVDQNSESCPPTTDINSAPASQSRGDVEPSTHTAYGLLQDRPSKAIKSTWRRKLRKPMVLFTFIIVIATIAQVWVGILQYVAADGQLKLMGRQTDAMVKQTEDFAIQTNLISSQTKLMEAQTKQMEAQAKQSRLDSESSDKRAEETLRKTLAQSKAALDASVSASVLDQRAWAGISSFALPECLDESNKRVYFHVGCSSRFGVNISNFGKTPAVDVSIEVGAVMQSAHLGWRDPAYDNRAGIFSRNTLFPGPGGTNYSERFPRPITEDVLTAIKSGAIVAYFYGRFSYKDIAMQAHQTTFCAFVSKDLAGLEVCAFYNTAN